MNHEDYHLDDEFTVQSDAMSNAEMIVAPMDDPVVTYPALVVDEIHHSPYHEPIYRIGFRMETNAVANADQEHTYREQTPSNRNRLVAALSMLFGSTFCFALPTIQMLSVPQPQFDQSAYVPPQSLMGLDDISGPATLEIDSGDTASDEYNSRRQLADPVDPHMIHTLFVSAAFVAYTAVCFYRSMSLPEHSEHWEPAYPLSKESSNDAFERVHRRIMTRHRGQGLDDAGVAVWLKEPLVDNRHEPVKLPSMVAANKGRTDEGALFGIFVAGRRDATKMDAVFLHKGRKGDRLFEILLEIDWARYNKTQRALLRKMKEDRNWKDSMDSMIPELRMDDGVPKCQATFMLKGKDLNKKFPKGIVYQWKGDANDIEWDPTTVTARIQLDLDKRVPDP